MSDVKYKYRVFIEMLFDFGYWVYCDFDDCDGDEYADDEINIVASNVIKILKSPDPETIRSVLNFLANEMELPKHIVKARRKIYERAMNLTAEDILELLSAESFNEIADILVRLHEPGVVLSLTVRYYDTDIEHGYEVWFRVGKVDGIRAGVIYNQPAISDIHHHNANPNYMARMHAAVYVKDDGVYVDTSFCFNVEKSIRYGAVNINEITEPCWWEIKNIEEYYEEEEDEEYEYYCGGEPQSACEEVYEMCRGYLPIILEQSRVAALLMLLLEYTYYHNMKRWK